MLSEWGIRGKWGFRDSYDMTYKCSLYLTKMAGINVHNRVVGHDIKLFVKMRARQGV